MSRYPLCHVNDIPFDGAKSFRLVTDARQIDLFVIRQAEHFFAYDNHCPHTGVNLNWQADQFLDYFNEFIQCATHGALFTIQTGLCIRGPCAGQSLLGIPLQIDAQIIYAIID